MGSKSGLFGVWKKPEKRLFRGSGRFGPLRRGPNLEAFCPEHGNPMGLFWSNLEAFSAVYVPFQPLLSDAGWPKNGQKTGFLTIFLVF